MAFDTADKSRLLEHLKGETHVILAGTDEKGAVFAVVRVANGTEDQQCEAVERWAQEVGRRFPHASGCPSLIPASLKVAAITIVGALQHTNWRAVALQTACFERYQSKGEYSKPLKIERRSPASASERAKAYADTVEGLDAPGRRNAALAGAMLNIGTKFGTEAMKAVMPSLLARSTLPEKEKQKLAAKKLVELERKTHK